MDMDNDEPDESDRWYRSKLAARIPRHRRKVRAAAFVVLGAFKIAGTGIRVTGTGVRRYRRRRDSRRVPGRGAHCGACGVSYRTVSMLNEHYRTVHADVPAKPQPKRRPIRRPPNAKREQIRPANRGSVVAGTTNPPNPRTAAAVDKYRDHITSLGERAMSDNAVTQHLRRAAGAMEDQNPTGRTEMNTQVAGLEAGLAALAEAVDGYAVRLKRPHPRGEAVRGPIAPELVNPHFKRLMAALEEAQQAAASYVASFEDINALAIRAARGELDNGGSKFLGR